MGRLNRADAKAAARNYTKAGPVTVINTRTGEKRTEKPYTPAQNLDIVGALGYRENPTARPQTRR